MTIELRNEPVQKRSKLRLEQLEAAARQVLAEDGRDRLTTGRIAEVAGCSIGTVYRYFPDRVAALDLIAPDRDAAAEKLAELEGELAAAEATIDRLAKAESWNDVVAALKENTSRLAQRAGSEK